MATRHAIISGTGVVSSLGLDIDSFEAAVLSGSSSITRLGEYPPARLKFKFGAPITTFDPSLHFDARTLGGLDRFAQFATVAAREAWKKSGLDGAVAPERIGVILGSANVGNDILEQGWRRIYDEKKLPYPLTIPMAMANAPASRIAREIGARGPVFAVGSACASAAHAILLSLYLIRTNACDVIVTGGTDSSFTAGFLQMWDVLRVVSPDICRPFSRERQGLTIGEGAGIIVIERAAFAKARGAVALASLDGGAMNCDAGELTTPDQRGMLKAMADAIADAGIGVGDIGYVNAHGTGTIANDRLEASAINSLFSGHGAVPPVSSSKSAFGHAMGASGALELLVAIAALRRQVVPPTLNFVAPDPECPIDAVTEGPRPVRLRHALSNSFAFGGLNVSLVVSAPRPAKRAKAS